MFSRAAALVLALLATTGAVADEAVVRDPMRPFASAAANGAATVRPRFELTAVLISSARRIAVINGKRFGLGASVDGAELVAIEPGVVKLRENGAEREVHLGRPTSDRPSVTQGGNGP